MIIYGTRAKELGTKRIPGEKSPYDETKDIEITGVAKYFHIFWIPLFPYSKKVYPYCPSTNQQIANQDISQRTENKIKEAKKSMKSPIYMYSGLIIIAGLILLGIYNDGKRFDEVGENLQTLKASDILVLYDQEDTNYTFAVVTDVDDDVISLKFSNYYFESAPSESLYYKEREKYDDFYDTNEYYFQQSELDSLHKIEKIYDLYIR
jgi:hypothetical protein